VYVNYRTVTLKHLSSNKSRLFSDKNTDKGRQNEVAKRCLSLYL